MLYGGGTFFFRKKKVPKEKTPKGCAPWVSLGVLIALSRFLGTPRDKRTPPPPPGKLEGAVFSFNTETGKCTAVQAVRVE